MPPFPLPAGVRVVAFDAVGTLIHPEPPATAVYAAVGARFGSRRTVAEIAERFRTAFRREEDWDRQHGWRTSEAREHERWRRIVAAVLDDVADAAGCFRELFDHFARPDAWRCGPEVGPVLTALAGHGLHLVIASNYDQRLRTVAAGLPDLGSIERIVISSEVRWRKPAPEFFRALMDGLGCAPAEVLHVGDDPVNDYDGACAAGLRAVVVGPSSGLRFAPAGDLRARTVNPRRET
jgi:putative hydrolase of the HAD superfamily